MNMIRFNRHMPNTSFKPAEGKPIKSDFNLATYIIDADGNTVEEPTRRITDVVADKVEISRRDVPEITPALQIVPNEIRQERRSIFPFLPFPKFPLKQERPSRPN